MNPKRSEVIKLFLEENTHPDLAELYNSDLEVQVNMAQDNGERVDRHYKGKDWHEWTDGIQTWKTFRIPRNAWTEPVDNDYIINFDLSTHVEGIGLTGWNWKERKSLWVAFDFDAIVGHSDKHSKKLTDDELKEIVQRLSKVPWTEIRYSTSGRGLHVYVFLHTPVNTNNHNEHMALARAVLGQLSIETDYDFKSKVDAHGAVMWIWHRKMRGNGLKLIKKSESKLTNIPPNWKDHLDVVKGKRKRIIPFFIKEGGQKERDLFEELSGQRMRVPLDEEHKRLLTWLKLNDVGGSWFDEDHWLLITHTQHLAKAHQELKLKGIFKTISPGTNTNEQNAFAFPMHNGAWTVKRYTPGTVEDPTWTQDGTGYTSCYYNRVPTFELACRNFGGVEKPVAGGLKAFVFSNAKDAQAALSMLESKVIIPERMLFRPVTLKQHKDNRVIIESSKQDSDLEGHPDFDGWLLEKKTWKRITDVTNEPNIDMIDGISFDKYVRHIVTEAGQNYGWVVKSGEVWKQEPLEHVKLVLEGSFGLKPSEVKAVTGSAIMQPWTIVNIPFEEEFLPDRRWNRNAVKFRFDWSQDLENLKYPTWMKIFDHLGKGLDIAIKDHPWAIANNVNSGSDYLMLWVACLFQHPMEQLPYLFFWSDKQETGKSTFHEALQLLITDSGYIGANNALEPGNNFNGELQNAILCVIEEKNLNKSKSGSSVSYNRIKEWVTAKSILIHEKNKTPFMVPNTTHWIHAANDRTAVPIFPGDKRITMIYVYPFDELEMIPKSKLFEQLEKEAPDFLAAMMNIQIPESNERLLLPIIETEDKVMAEELNMTPIEIYIREYCYPHEGNLILWKEFYEQFAKHTDPMKLETWTKTYTSKNLPPQYPVGRNRKDGHFYIANIGWSPPKPGERGRKYISVNKTLYVEGEYDGKQREDQIFVR